MASKRVLFCVLNWGLGHATRSIPVIHELRKMGAEVIIAGDGASARLLKNEFPHLQHLPLPSIEVRYPSGIWLFPYLILKALSLLPKLIYERYLVKKYIAKYMITHLISDNRPFSYFKQVKTAYITHQVRMKPAFIGLAHRFFFFRFHEVWVPAPQAGDALTGNLAKGAWPRKKVKYIGYLNVFKLSKNLKKKYKYLVVLSGPEPQRTLLEQELIEQMEASGRPCVLIRGLARKKKPVLPKLKYVKVFSFADSKKIIKYLELSECLLARPGYSTLMNLAGTHIKGVFIPTPGQTEQLYLAKNLEKNQIAICAKQGGIHLESLLENVRQSKGFYELETNSQALKNTLADFLEN